MFCTKCGYNAGDARFCARCGAPITAEVPVESPVQESVQESVAPEITETQAQEMPTEAQVQQPEQPAEVQVQQPEQPAEVQVQQPEQPAEPQMQQPIQPQFYGMPADGQQQTAMPTPNKKKRGWMIAAIVAAIVIVLGVGSYFAYPYISELVSPKKQAVTALKNAGADFEALVTDSISTLSTTTASTQNEIKGSFKIGSVNVDGTNYMSYLKVDTINYDIQADASTETVSGTIGLASGSGSNVINMQFYTDASYVYFKIPELFTESFKMSVNDLGLSTTTSSSIIGSFGGLGSVSSMLGTADASTLAQYSDIIEAVLKDVMTGFDKMVEKCTYKKVGSTTYQSENGDIKVTTYDVTLTAAAMTEGVNTAIDALYNDSAVSSYMSLFTSMMGGSKDTIKSSVSAAFSTMPDIPFTIYVNRDDNITKVMMDLSAVDSTVSGDISVEFIGKDKPMEYIVMQADVDEIFMKYTIKSSQDTASVAFEMIPDQKTNSGEFLNMGFDMSTSGTKMSISNCYVKGSMNGTKIDVSMSGDATTSEFKTMSITSSAFKNSMNPSYLTTAQEDALATELAKNMDVINKVISDSLYKQIFGVLGTGTSSTSSTSRSVFY